MNIQKQQIEITKTLNFPVDIVCPCCHRQNFSKIGTASNEIVHITCMHCGELFSIENKFANLVVGERFNDESDEDCLCYEEASNQYTTDNFWIPLFKKSQKEQGRKLKILAVGCGIGREVDMLCDAGFDCVGIDNGNRAKIWPNRKYSNRFLMANGMHMPFSDKSFDVVFCGCVFPHVGVNGDSVNVTDDYFDDRKKLAAEMCRVVKADGEIVVASPNRKFPFDLFHGREQGSYVPRYNRPDERFLLNKNDYKALFFEAGCKRCELLPIKGYWGFVRSKYSFKGLLLSLPVRIIINLVSSPYLKSLRGSFISPWLTLSMKMSNE